MGKKKTGEQNKASAKAAKKAKAAQKVERKEKKKAGKTKKDEDEEDLEAILEHMRREWEEAHTVTEEIVEGPPSRRANATLTACPSGNYLWCIGGEFFSEDGKAYFYNDVYRYTPEKNEWRKFVSRTCPGPRSAHATVASPAGGGKLFLFGGEFSSLHQNSFHHYRDFWCFDVTTHSWDRIETKVRPSARSGCRMAMWKHYIFLFGGFYDPGIRANYLNDLWYFDTQEYQWKQVEFRENDRRPSPRSGFSFLPTSDGVVLHGGYCKEYAKGKRPVGVMLEDTWFLRITPNTIENAGGAPAKVAKNQHPFALKWEKRKKVGYAPTLRSGCTMALWSSKGMGVLFGGVTDEDTNEETLESVFHNDMYGYQLTGNGRWVSLTLRKPKRKGKQGGAKKKHAAAQTQAQLQEPEEEDEEGRLSDEDDRGDHDNELKIKSSIPPVAVQQKSATSTQPEVYDDPDFDPDDPFLTIPRARYNSMLAVLRNTLYIYGGILELGPREYTLDDFYALALDKLDRFTCLKPCDVEPPKDGEIIESSEDETDDDDDDDDEDDEEDGEVDDRMDDNDEVVEEKSKARRKQKKAEATEVQEEEVVEQEDESELRKKAQAFLGASNDVKVAEARSMEDIISTPLPGETLAMFYARSREYWAGKAHASSDNRGKMLRRDGFALAQERYTEYKPLLEEVEKILAEAGLDEEEIKRGAAAGAFPKQSGESRNRR